MSTKSTSFSKKLNAAMQELDTEMRNIGNTVQTDVARGVYSQESFDHFESNVQVEAQSIVQAIGSTLGDVDPSLRDQASLENHEESLRAGVIAAMAAQNPTQYHQAALKAHNSDGTMSLESLFSGAGGNLEVDASSDYSMEAFDATELSNFTAQNIAFNILASRQDSFAEGFFPTKVVAPSEGGITITVDRQEVINYTTHGTAGTEFDVNRKNLLDAYTDAEILNRPATELVPFARTDGSTDDSFVAESLVSTVQRDISGHSVPTRPLVMGKRVNLKNLSQHPGLIDNGILDITDQIAPGMKVKTLYVSVGSGDSAEVIPMNVEFIVRNQFRKSHEGRGREVVLNMPAEALSLSSKDGVIRTADGSESALLKPVVTDQGLEVRVAVAVNGHGNLDTGLLEVNAGSLTVEGVFDEGGPIAVDSGEGKAVVDLLDGARIVGYDLSARLSNSNWRSTGPIIDVTPYTESYAIVPGYPITVLTATEESQHGSKISGMVNAARIRNSNNAVTTLLNYEEQLEAYAEGMRRGIKYDLVGAARHVIRPFYDHRTFDVADAVVVENTHRRGEDVSHALVSIIRDMAWNMYRDSNYGPALDLATGGTDAKPTLLIGCDSVIARHLNITADERLLGGEMDYKIVQTNDSRMDGQIKLTFTRGRPGSEDGLSFGVHAYVPELIQRVTTQRNGSTAKNDRVIPRSIHVPVLPVMGAITVKNLSKATTNV